MCLAILPRLIFREDANVREARPESICSPHSCVHGCSRLHLEGRRRATAGLRSRRISSKGIRRNAMCG